jgi:hypothetical protein
VDTIFNNFLTTYLRIFCHCFPLRKVKKTNKKNGWITKGIKVSCTHKRDLYLLSRSSNDPIIKKKNYYKRYSQVLADIIKAARKLHYSNKIVNSTNKIKTVWQIVKSETNTNHENHNIPPININGELSDNYHNIANEFNKYIADIANEILTNNPLDNNTTNSTQILTNNPLDNNTTSSTQE